MPRWVILLVFILLVAGGCDPESDDGGGSSGGGGSSATTSSTFACPNQFPADDTKTAANSGVSSISVYGGSEATLSGSAWCGSPALSITKINVLDLVGEYGCPDSSVQIPCIDYDALDALDVGPDGTAFSSPTPSWPDLRFDLGALQKPCSEGCQPQIYQVVNGEWRSIGPAEFETFNGTDVAVGKIGHFSVFALVDLPDPQLVPPLQIDGVVTSTFRHEPPEDGNEPIRVAILFERGIPELEIEGPAQRILRLSDVDPSNLSESCGRGTVGDSLTCVLPIGTPVLLTLDENYVGIESFDSGEFYELSVSAIEIF